MLTYIPLGVEVPEQSLTNGAICNNDGHGWAVANADDLIVGKSMHYPTAIKDLVAARDSLPNSAAIFHSRWATHGAINEFNTHPFYVSESAVMAHNGIMPRKYQPEKEDPRSDTRVFADLIAEKFVANPNGIPSRRAGRRIANLIGRGNKLVFLGKSPTGPQVRIVNEQAGYSVKGVWYSNSDFMGRKYFYDDGYRPANPRSGAFAGTKYGTPALGSATTGSLVLSDDSEFDYGEYASYTEYLQAKYGWSFKKEEPVEEPCDNCGVTYWDKESKVCKICFTCYECRSPIEECVCWIPPVKHTDTTEMEAGE